jgi:hypothetical protein
MKVYRKRNSSKIKTLVIAMVGGKSKIRGSKCGLAAVEQQIKLSIVGIFVLMMTIVQCIGATGTYMNSFIMIFSCASLLMLLLLQIETREEILLKIISLRSLLNM